MPPSQRRGTRFDARGIPKTIAELEAKAQDPGIWQDQKAANALFAELRTLRKLWEPIANMHRNVGELVELTEQASEGDLASLQQEADKLSAAWPALETGLYLAGEFDRCNAYLTVSGGAGGTEAQDWAAMLARMYLRFAERKGWKSDVIDRIDGQEAGVKSITIFIEGDLAYGELKCEKGTHRLVRISPFGAKGLRQTSFSLVEVLPELPEGIEITIPDNDMRVDTYRSGGAGGQHVNKTESAVRITHLPTGVVVACQTERNQIQNRARAMAMLQAKLMERQRMEMMEKKSELKGASQSADFGQQIRSYVLHPYQMVKDLRTDVETSNTQAVLDGDIQDFIDAELKRLAKEGS